MSDTDATMDESARDELWDRRWAVLSKAWVQVRYHKRRQRFFDLLDKGTKALTICLGASLFGAHLAVPVIATAITAIGMMALVFGYSDRKQQHRVLAEAAAELIGQVEDVPFSRLGYEQMALWEGEYARFCAKAPPPLKTLTLICEREQAVACGSTTDHIDRPALWRLLLADFKN